MSSRAVVDSRLPRFSQALQAAILAVAFLLEARVVVPVVAVIMALAALGGRRWNAWARLYRVLRIPPGPPEPAAPPRFAQTLGAIFLTIATVGLYAAEEGSGVYNVLGWGPAIVVTVLAALAATTSF